MLTEYINAAMHKAEYERLEDGVWFATIPGLDGLWASAPTVEKSREELRSALEGWLLLSLRMGDVIPVINDIDLNISLEPTEVA